MLPSMGKHTYHLAPRQRYQMVKDYLSGHKVANICRFYGIPSKTFYYWLNVWKADPDNFAKNVANTDTTPKNMPFITDKATTELIIRLRKKSKFGPKRLQLLLRERGIIISASGIYKVLKREGLIKKRKKKRKKKYKKYTAFMKAPGERVQVDVVWLPKLFNKTHRQYVYQAIDLYTRATFSAVYTECTPRASIHFLKRVQKFFPFEVSTFQFDHGVEFTYDMLIHVSKKHPMHNYLEKQGINYKFSPVATPRMNGCVERVHRTWREEMERWHKWKTPNQLFKDNLRWMKYYNEQRPHFGVNLQTPLQRLREVKKHKTTSFNYSI